MTTRYPDGGVVSHSLPFRPRGAVPPGTSLGAVRAVVLRTYYPDGQGLRQGLGIECDVLVYGATGRRLYRVPVRGGGGAYDLAWWVPAPTTTNLRTGAAVTDLEGVDNPADLDGDHVLVEFLGGRSDDPLITSPLPHPKAKTRPRGGNVAAIPADAAHPALPDGLARFVSHAGTDVLLDRRGNVVVDTTKAPRTAAGEPAGGSEPAGRVVLQLGGSTRLEVRVGDTVLLTIEGGQVKIGASPTSHGTLYEALKSAWDSMTVPTAFGPSGNPAPLPTSCKSPGVLLDAP